MAARVDRPDLVIRRFTSADEEAVVALWEDAGLTRPWNDPRKDIARKRTVQPEGFIVAVAGEEIVGSVMAGYDGHRGWVNYLAVAPHARRSGVGRSLMAEAEQVLEGLGCPKVNLQIRATNLTAVALLRGARLLDRRGDQPRSTARNRRRRLSPPSPRAGTAAGSHRAHRVARGSGGAMPPQPSRAVHGRSSPRRGQRFPACPRCPRRPRSRASGR